MDMEEFRGRLEDIDTELNILIAMSAAEYDNTIISPLLCAFVRDVGYLELPSE